MSREAVEALVGKMKADDGFRAEILAAKGLEERLELARKAGFECTADEIGELRAELADGDLAAAAGGYCSPEVWGACFGKNPNKQTPTKPPR